MVRSVSLSSLGRDRAAEADLLKADDFVDRDPKLLRWIMARHPLAERRLAAARDLLNDQRSGSGDALNALRLLFSSGEGVVLHAQRPGRSVEGWVVSQSIFPSALHVRTSEGDTRLVRLGEPRALSASENFWRCDFSLSADLATSIEITALSDDRRSRSTTLLARENGDVGRPGRAAPQVGLTVIVPVFGDPESLSACLSTMRPDIGGDVAAIVIDDASPDGAVSSISRQFCAETGALYRRAALNVGFAASVNSGLSLCSEVGDVLILNSDVLLPPGALSRLRAAAHSAFDIGTVTPFSNDSGQTSFPDPLNRGPVTSEGVSIDRAAEICNRGQIADVLAPLGSCLYVTRACLDRVGPLSLAYGRGYYEDIDLCLRAREAGLRNVAACDVYVTHIGGRSFGSDKQALVARNHRILARRFPDYEVADAIFDRADPLRPYRGAIEKRLNTPSTSAVVIVVPGVGHEALIAHRSTKWREQGRPVLVLRWSRQNDRDEASLSVHDGEGPRSLRFSLSNDLIGELESYLSQLRHVDVELVRPQTVPAALVDALLRSTHPISVLIDDDAIASLAARLRGATKMAVDRSASLLDRGWWPDRADAVREMKVVPLDAMAAAMSLDQGTARPGQGGAASFKPGPRRSSRSCEILGILLPHQCPEAERFILGLVRRLRRAGGTEIVVIGSAIDEKQLTSPGNVWVTGPSLGDDPADISAHYEADVLLSPYRSSAFWYLAAVKAKTGLRSAYFDWSRGHMVCDAADLALNPDWNDETALGQLVPWLVGDGA